MRNPRNTDLIYQVTRSAPFNRTLFGCVGERKLVSDRSAALSHSLKTVLLVHRRAFAQEGTTDRHSGAPRSGEPGSHIPEVGVHGFRAASRRSAPGMTVIVRSPSPGVGLRRNRIKRVDPGRGRGAGCGRAKPRVGTKGKIR